MLNTIFTTGLLASLAFTTTTSATPVLVARQDPTGTSTSALTTATATSEELHAQQAALLALASAQDRQDFLIPNPPDASNYTFQFVNETVEAPTGGFIHLSTLNNFPALLSTNVALAIGWVNPCGLNVPHSHPRANEYLATIQGELIAGMVLEGNEGSAGNVPGGDGNPTGPGPFVNATLSLNKGFLFPKGLTHFQFNPTCEPAAFVAAFDSSDPGRSQVARTFFSEYPDEVLLSAMGIDLDGDSTVIDASTVDTIRGKVPSAFVELMAGCAAECGIPTSK